MYQSKYPLLMKPESISRFQSFARQISLFVIGVGCLVMVGWALDIAAFKSILPSLGSMKSNTALALILGGLSLRMQVGGRTTFIAQSCAFIVALMGLLTLGEYVFNVNLGIDQLVFNDTTPGGVYPGRMSPATALAFLLLGLALLFLDRQSEDRSVEPLAIIAFAISGLALIGYLYGVSSLYQLGVYSSMALHTALSLLLLSLGVLFARPQRGLMKIILGDTLGGDVLRRFLPIAMMLPVILGWMRLWGQRAGLYDTALGLALLVISLITTLTVFVLLNAMQLTSIDIKRSQTDENLRASELRFRSTLESMMEGCQIVGYDWRYLFLNDAAVHQSQLTRNDLLGHTMMECYPGIEETALFTTLRECMEQRTSRHMINEFIYPNGSRGWFELSIQPAPDGIFILSTDITRHKQSEARLLEREMKLTTLFEILPVGISILDAERKISYTNPALKRILDISDEGLLKGAYQNRGYLRADGSPMPVDEFASTRAFQDNQEVDGVETGVVKEDGTIVWTEVSAVPVDFPDWKLVVVTSDITERKQAETALSQERELLRTLVDNMPEEVYVKDRERRFLLVNKLVLSALGVQHMDDIIGKRDEDFLPPEMAKQFADEEDEIIRTGRPLIDDEHSPRHMEGPRKWYTRTKLPLRDGDGKIIGLLGLGSDITERKRAEEDLRANERRLHLAASAGGVGIWDWDVVKDELIWDESMYLLYNIHPKDFSGAYHAWISTLHPEDREYTDGEIQAALRGEREYAPEFRIIRPDGIIRTIKATSLTLRDENGKALRMIGTNVDITERKQVEEEILRLNADLERKVSERTAELAQANEFLQQVSLFDQLTGLYNRRGFLMLAEEQLSLARRAKWNLVLFYADLDGLKQVNDRYGHAAGDQAIISAARALEKAFRASDIKARLGGDEFIVLAFEINHQAAEKMISRLHKKLAEKDQSMSVGMVALDPGNEMSVDEIIARADEAMYAEKRAKPQSRT